MATGSWLGALFYERLSILSFIYDIRCDWLITFSHDAIHDVITPGTSPHVFNNPSHITCLFSYHTLLVNGNFSTKTKFREKHCYFGTLCDQRSLFGNIKSNFIFEVLKL